MDNRRILVVEDSHLLLQAIRDLLEIEGYSVFTATNGIEALEAMEDVVPDLIIADISMPRMDGYAFYEAVRKRPEWVPIPFIFLTAKAEREDRLLGKSMGVEDYITKPFDPQDLVVSVESRLGRAQAIREATAVEFEELKRQIINLLSHELRTPLTSVYGYTELALEEAADLSADEFRDFLVKIKQGADRLVGLVEDLLWLIRLDTGQLEEEFRILSKEDDDIGNSVAKTLGLFKAQMDAKGIELQLDVQPALPSVRVHNAFLVDIISRLMDNAIKFSRKKGKLITVNVTADEAWVNIAITDQGVGIPVAQIKNLFERFRQIDRARMEQQGIGMGLVIAMGMAECMGGTIEAESEENLGSTFTLRLPAITEA